MKSLGVVILGVLLAALMTSSLHADQFTIQGAFKLDPQKSDNIEQAIETAVAPMIFPFRYFMRNRLLKLNIPYPNLFIQLPPHEVVFAIDERPPIRTPNDGKPIQWTRDDGEALMVSTKLGKMELDQTFAAKDGKRVNNYELSPDGQELLMHVTLISHRLKGPVSYTLVYHRSS